MKKIDNYCIMAFSNRSQSYYYISGFSPLSTMRKKFNALSEHLSKGFFSHPDYILCARDSEGNILKIYGFIKGVQ